ncbi:MAG: valine--tRNA ligase [Fimbriimonadaceae bacterium]|nr:valine--tRNA ligase [Fimbriimonadaceae bacterium]
MTEPALSSRYDASLVESKWYQAWEKAGLFQPDPDESKPAYCVTIPPPNITGSLHMGHALCYPIQDLLGRYRRLRGDRVLILPGQDHAGIATQGVVTRQLKKEGSSPSAIGRDKFVERVWQWRQESGDTILRQFRSLGCAFDWSRSRFTLDDAYHDAVLKVFVDWFEKGLIYRGKRVVNWDPALRTSVSDIEVERKTVRGKLYHIRYPLEDGSGDVTIATTRPETMLADVAVAVHPDDARYRHLVGRALMLPLVGRAIPIIADPYPDPEFGTGAVKITPAHDANDFEVGARHGLPMPVLIDEDAKITAEGGVYAGLDRYEARKRVVADLDAQGFLVRVDDYDIPIQISERSGEVIEPLLSEQWFVRQSELAKPGIEAVRAGEIRFFPERYADVYRDWMENIRDWCVSRQLWWGHRVPVYYAEDGTAFAGLNWEDAQAKAGGKRIVRQDEDVLDTWFSSGLWPFATLGWPETTDDLRRFYPTSALVTDRNIIYLWVARMIMMGLHFLGEVPFREVYIYATVLTEDGRRMSKSLGTGVDPMGIIETKGADALRFTLVGQAGYNQDIRYSDRRTDDARNFCNKMWNATRFVLMNAEGGAPQTPGELEPADRWLLSRLAGTEKTVREAYDRYDMQESAQTLQRFFWSEVCDWYVEIAKSRLTDPERRHAPLWTLLTVFEAYLAMLHPIMPHITEELYHHLPLANKAPFLMAATWPDGVSRFADDAAETRFERYLEITRALRALRAELGLSPIKLAPVAYYEGDLEGGADVVRTQAWFERLEAGACPDKAISATVAGVDLHVPIAGLIDEERELARLTKDEEKTRAEVEKVEGRLANPEFAQRAKPEVVERERGNLLELRAKLEKIVERRRLFGGS